MNPEPILSETMLHKHERRILNKLLKPTGLKQINIFLKYRNMLLGF